MIRMCCAQQFEYTCKTEVRASGIARPFPDGRATQPENQIEEENDEKLGENNQRMKKCSSLAHMRLRVWLHPWFKQGGTQLSFW